MDQTKLLPPIMSRGEGTSADEGRLKKIPTPILGIVASFLTDKEIGNVATTNHSLERRVSLYLDPKKLGADLAAAAEGGKLNTVKVLTSRLQSSKAEDSFKHSCFIEVADNSAAFHPRMTNYALNQIPTTTAADKCCYVFCPAICWCILTCGFTACKEFCCSSK